MDYEKKYKEAVAELIRISHDSNGDGVTLEKLERIFPELAESEDEKIRRALIKACKQSLIVGGFHKNKVIAYLEKQKPVTMIQWTGDNLQEVIRLTGLVKDFSKWFKSWDDYENYVHSHGDIFKIFNEDGSHIEIPVGAWIIKTPDGYNTASHYNFVQKPVEWSNEIQEEFERKYNEGKAVGIEIGKNGVQNSVEWSEEDEKMLNQCAAAIHAADYYDLDDKNEMETWLKSLRDRCMPQSQEWSEEDEKMLKELDIAVSMSEGHTLDEKENLSHFLKSLRPQKQWKPSEEQMKELFNMLHRGNTVVLNSLYEDLKAL